MKTLITITTVLALSSLYLLHSSSQFDSIDQIQSLWQSWKSQYNKAYDTRLEELHRFKIFSKNVERITTHNSKPDETFSMALNQFGDLTMNEFNQKIRCLGTNKAGGPDMECPSSPIPEANACPLFPNTSATSWDWVAKGVVTAVKNQGECGSCWAFGATGALEGQYALQKGLLLSFSEQYLMDCDTTCESCEGCFDSVAMQFVATNGIVAEQLYPYKGVDEPCKVPKGVPLIKVNKGVNCVTKRDYEQMKSALTVTPLAISVEADGSSWQFYSGGIITKDCGSAINHNVLLVGFDTNQTYWKVKNSWGPNWGEAGYVRIAIDPSSNEGNGNCGVLRCGVIPS